MVYAMITHVSTFHGKRYGIYHGCTVTYLVKRNRPWGMPSTEHVHG